MSAGQAVVVSVSLAFMLMITAAVTVVWRERVFGRRDKTPEDRYRHVAEDLRKSGGGIHPGGQPYVPPPPSNMSSGWGEGA